MLKEREPEYARRRDDSSLGDSGSVGGLLKEAEALAAGRPTPDLIPDVLQGEPDGAEVPAPAAPRPTARSEARTPSTAQIRLQSRREPARASAAAARGTYVRLHPAAPRQQHVRAAAQLLEELGAQLRSGVEKLGDLPHETGDLLARELGLATREELDTLELRLAQLEHRLKLLENA